MPRGVAGRIVVAAAWLVLVCGCDEESGVFTDVGTTRVFFTDPFLAAQSLKDPALPLQVAEWTVTRAVVQQGATSIDLLAGSACSIVDTAVVFPQSSDRCNGGLIVDSGTAAEPATLTVEFTMQVRRAKPIDLPPGDDADGDGVVNADDTCPLVANADQAIDPCSFIDPASGAFVADSDGDGVADPVDNCVGVPNEAQEDSTGPRRTDGIRIPDLIGDACEEQTATVEAGGSTSIEIVSGPLTYVQPQSQLTFWVVDLSNPDTLSCNWSAGSCTLAPSAVQICLVTGFASALGGCPD